MAKWVKAKKLDMEWMYLRRIGFNAGLQDALLSKDRGKISAEKRPRSEHNTEDGGEGAAKRVKRDLGRGGK